MIIIAQFVARLWKIVYRDVFWVIFWVVILNFGFACGFYFAERGVQEISFQDAVWWSMVTMTTVGYGDFYAQTAIGRFAISYPCMIVGIGVVGYMVGLVANAILDLSNRKRKGEMDINFKNHIVICNYPSQERILTVVSEIRANPNFKKSKIVLINNILEQLPERLNELNIHFVKGLPTDETILERASILDAAGVIILAQDPADVSSDDRTYMIGSMIETMERDHGKPVKTVAEVVAKRHIRNMELAKIDGYVTDEELTGCMLVQEFCNPGVHHVYSQLLSNTHGSQFYIRETQLQGLKIRDIQRGVLDHDANVQIIGIIQNGKQILNPPKNIELGRGDQLIYLAENPGDLDAVERDLSATQQ